MNKPEPTEHPGFIGLFWYNDTKKKLINVREDVSKIFIPLEKEGDSNYYVIGSYAHFAAWTGQVSKDNGGVDYKYYPRGRVVYFPQRREFKIYADRCIPADVIGEIKKAFFVGGDAEIVHEQGYDDKVNRLAKAGHYTCHLCRKGE